MTARNKGSWSMSVSAQEHFNTPNNLTLKQEHRKKTGSEKLTPNTNHGWQKRNTDDSWTQHSDKLCPYRQWFIATSGLFDSKTWQWAQDQQLFWVFTGFFSTLYWWRHVRRSPCPKNTSLFVHSSDHCFLGQGTHSQICMCGTLNPGRQGACYLLAESQIM